MYLRFAGLEWFRETEFGYGDATGGGPGPLQVVEEDGEPVGCFVEPGWEGEVRGEKGGVGVAGMDVRAPGSAAGPMSQLPSSGL